MLMSVNLITLNANIRDDNFLSMKKERHKIIIDEMKKLNNCFFLGEVCWYYLFSNVKPEIDVAPIMYNPRYNKFSEFFKSTFGYKIHQKLINKSGLKFISTNNTMKNIFAVELFKYSKEIKKIGNNYTIRMIK